MKKIHAKRQLPVSGRFQGLRRLIFIIATIFAVAPANAAVLQTISQLQADRQAIVAAPAGQTFEVKVTGQITSISLSPSNSGNALLSIFAGEYGNDLHTELVTTVAQPNGFSIQTFVLTPPVPVSPGTYTLELFASVFAQEEEVYLEGQAYETRFPVSPAICPVGEPQFCYVDLVFKVVIEGEVGAGLVVDEASCNTFLAGIGATGSWVSLGDYCQVTSGTLPADSSLTIAGNATLRTQTGTFTNLGTIVIDSTGPGYWGAGTLENRGTFSILAADQPLNFGTILNYGTFNTAAPISNAGTLYNFCGGVVVGIILINPSEGAIFCGGFEPGETSG